MVINWRMSERHLYIHRNRYILLLELLEVVTEARGNMCYVEALQKLPVYMCI